MDARGEVGRDVDARKDEREARSRVKSGLETSFPRREILSLTISKPAVSNGIIINSGRDASKERKKRVRIGLSVFFFFSTKKRDDTVTAACLITRGEVAFVSCGSLSREREGKREKHRGSEKDWKKGKRGETREKERGSGAGCPSAVVHMELRTPECLCHALGETEKERDSRGKLGSARPFVKEGLLS